MTKIEEFLDKRDHIDKSELDLVVRNLIENSNNHAFPECKAKPQNVLPVVQPMTAVNRMMVEQSLSSHHAIKHRNDAGSSCMFPTISGDKEKVLGFSSSRIPRKPSGLMMRRDFTPIQDSEQDLVAGYFDDKGREIPEYYRKKLGNYHEDREKLQHHNTHSGLTAESQSSVKSQRSKHCGGEMTPQRLMKDAEEEFGARNNFPLNGKGTRII